MIAIAPPPQTSPLQSFERESRKFDDHQLEETALLRLRESGYPILSQVTCITCTCSTGVIWLTGRVPTYHMKQVAQTIILKIKGVRQIHNFLEVKQKKEQT